jgi:hypothetical protein
VAETSTILASLDQFIENFRTEDEIAIGHTVATAEQCLATSNPAEIQDVGHFSHFGHSGQDTHAHASPYNFCRREQTDAMGSRKLLYSDGYNGQSGQSGENRGFGSGQSGSGIGHSGHSSPQIGFNDFAIPVLPTLLTRCSITGATSTRSGRQSGNTTVGIRAWKPSCSLGENSNAGGIWRIASRLRLAFVRDANSRSAAST